MKSESIQRCPHFQLHSELLAVDGPAAYLAIRHCTLTARMLRLLEPVPEAAPLAQRLVIQTEAGRYFAFVGPDFEAVTQHSCTTRRCDDSCTSAYKETLRQFEVSDPNENEVTCDEEESPTVTDPPISESEAPPCTRS